MVVTAPTTDPELAAEAFGQCVTYGPTGMPDVMVLVDEAEERTWLPGRVRLQGQLEDQGWVFMVDYYVAGRSKTGTFPAHRIRGDAVALFTGRPVQRSRLTKRSARSHG